MAELSTREVLVKARALIEDPEHWTKGVFADGQGCYCAAGALLRVYYGTDPQPNGDNPMVVPGFEQLQHAMREMANEDARYFAVPHFNDTRSHAEVLAAFDKAIAGCDL